MMPTTPLIDGNDLADILDLDYADYDDALDQVSQAASDIVRSLVAPQFIDAPADPPAAVIEAALAIGAEIWQARTAAGGQAVAVDFSPGPYRMSVWMTRRVMALLAPYLNVKGLIG
jgi:hypothetical protein